jgi:hypothetical protein
MHHGIFRKIYPFLILSYLLACSVVDPDPLIRIRMDPRKIERKDPHPHQSDRLDPDPHLFADDKPKSMEYEPIEALFQGFESWKLGCKK